MTNPTRADSPAKICMMAGCDRALRAKGLCSSHYNRAMPAGKRHAKVMVACDGCGVPHVKYRAKPRWSGKQYCSVRCHADTWTLPHKAARAEAARQALLPVLWRPVKRGAADVVMQSPPRLFVSGACGWCGEQFVAQDNSGCARWCSRYCLKRQQRAKRGASTQRSCGTYTWAEVISIKLRIGGCAYCGVNADYIEPDHVVPLSRGGHNSITNVVPSCRGCNMDKHDWLVDEWIARREALGLSARRLDPRLTHLVPPWVIHPRWNDRIDPSRFRQTGHTPGRGD